MRVIGIDLGTTNSVVYTYERGVLIPVPINGYTSTPSIVCWNPNNQKVLIGREAKSRILINPETSVASNKRLMGNRDKMYDILGKRYSPVDISSILLQHLKAGASETLGEEVRQAVITVPAYFNQNQKEDTKAAAEKAGFEVLQLQAEPTAAALAYALDQNKDQTILVYDLGGGTFDVSVLQVSGNSFEVIAIGGDMQLGGDDFDDSILDFLYEEIKADLGLFIKDDPSMESKLARQQLKELAEQAKVELSSTLRTEIAIPSLMGKGSFECELSRATFQELIRPQVDQTVAIVEQVMEQAKLSIDDINRIICVGGSTKIPFVRETIKNSLKTPFIAPNVDEIVAMGAAITAVGIISPKLTELGDDNRPVAIKVKNVTPFDLGIQLENGRFGRLIQKNASLPAIVEKEFIIATDNATVIDIIVYQGLSDICSENTQLGGFRLKGLPKVKAGEGKVTVKFMLDESDILTVSARDKSRKAFGEITIEKYTPQPFQKSVYSQYAGQHHIPGVLTDQFGNPLGADFDLVQNNAFEGMTVAVLHLYSGERFDFSKPQRALQEKGFSIHRWTRAPSIDDFKGVLDNASQLWIISNKMKLLNQNHLNIIKAFFDAGKGIYIWGDNDPYYADANYVSDFLFGISMKGNTPGNKVVSLKKDNSNKGFISHLITTGIEYLYEGITIASLPNKDPLQPLLFGSAGNLVAAIYQKDGKRAIIDGGFTRLFVNWDTAGTGRYVKNAAAWLVNQERLYNAK